MSGNGEGLEWGFFVRGRMAFECVAPKPVSARALLRLSGSSGFLNNRSPAWWPPRSPAAVASALQNELLLKNDAENDHSVVIRRVVREQRWRGSASPPAAREDVPAGPDDTAARAERTPASGGKKSRWAGARSQQHAQRGRPFLGGHSYEEADPDFGERLQENAAKHVSRPKADGASSSWRVFDDVEDAKAWVARAGLPYDPVPLDTAINEVRLWHGTKSRNLEAILTREFTLADAKFGLYGKGIYHTNVICKAIQYADNPDFPKLILSRVLLGRNWEVSSNGNFRRADEQAFQRHFEGKYDSWRATSGKARGGEQVHNEYIVPDTNQVYPEYVVELARVA